MLYVGIAIGFLLGFLLGAPSGAYIICCFMGRIGGVMVKQMIEEGLIERGRAL